MLKVFQAKRVSHEVLEPCEFTAIWFVKLDTDDCCVGCVYHPEVDDRA